MVFAIRGQSTPGAGYFIEMDDTMDVSQVVRPRSSPLAKPVRTPAGRNSCGAPSATIRSTLIRESRNIAGDGGHYCLLPGPRHINLSFGRSCLHWKVIGTSCVNLPETHEIIRLLRTLVARRAPEAILITETNLPNRRTSLTSEMRTRRIGFITLRCHRSCSMRSHSGEPLI